MVTTETFKHHVANPGAPKAESLRQAMLKVMDLPQYRHPNLIRGESERKR